MDDEQRQALIEAGYDPDDPYVQLAIMKVRLLLAPLRSTPAAIRRGEANRDWVNQISCARLMREESIGRPNCLEERPADVGVDRT